MMRWDSLRLMPYMAPIAANATAATAPVLDVFHQRMSAMRAQRRLGGLHFCGHEGAVSSFDDDYLRHHVSAALSIAQFVADRCRSEGLDAEIARISEFRHFTTAEAFKRYVETDVLALARDGAEFTSSKSAALLSR